MYLETSKGERKHEPHCASEGTSLEASTTACFRNWLRAVLQLASMWGQWELLLGDGIVGCTWLSVKMPWDLSEMQK